MEINAFKFVNKIYDRSIKDKCHTSSMMNPSKTL